MIRTHIITLVRLACLSAAIFSVGCRRDASKSAAESPTDSADAATIVADSRPTENERDELVAAKDALFQKLSGRLTAAMAKGPAEAIAVCRREATQIAAAVGEEQGVRIGRVGVRLRNPNNVGPAWAAPLIESKTETSVFANLSNGNAAALLPIKMQSQCLMCHGPKEQIAPVIEQQLARLYPDDQAVGFQEGELRGWFWIEKPAS